MDLLRLLPVEIAEKVLSELHSLDLWTCMSVSHHWRILANRNHLWRQHCKKDMGHPTNEVQYSECGYFGDSMQLCPAAAMWSKRKHQITSWSQHKFSSLYWPKHEDPKAYSIYGNRLAVRTEKRIYIYIITEEGTLRIDSIPFPWDCHFEFRLMEMSSKYIIVGFNNVILVYELNNTYFLKMVYTFTRNAVMATKNIYDFIEAGRNTFFVNVLKIVKISGESLWVKVKYMYFHSTYFHIDLITGKATNVFPFRNVKFLHGTEKVLMFREYDDEVLLLASQGGQLLHCLEVGQYFSLCGNDRLLAVTTELGLSTFEISTGNNLAFIPTHKFSKYIAVNPHFDIVYCINEDHELRKDIFSSYCMRTGKQLWSRTLQVKIPEYFRLNVVTMSVLCGAFIIIKKGGTDPPYLEDEHTQQKKEFYVFDGSSGDLLYNKPYEKFLLFTDSYLCDKKFLRSAI